MITICTVCHHFGKKKTKLSANYVYSDTCTLEDCTIFIMEFAFNRTKDNNLCYLLLTLLVKEDGWLISNDYIQEIFYYELLAYKLFPIFIDFKCLFFIHLKQN